MNPSRTAVISTVTCIGAWTAKSLAIGSAGGLGRSPLEGPLFLIGLVAYVVAVVALSLALSAGRPTGTRALAVGAGVAGGVGLSLATNVVVLAVRPADPIWVWGEVNLWVGAAVLLALVLGTARFRTPAPRTA